MVVRVENEWCIKCSQPVNRLSPVTGWCYPCSKHDPYHELEAFLSTHANHLEHYLAKGDSLRVALRAISTEVRPSCLSCGRVIARAPRNAMFCTKFKRCNSMRNRYIYLYRDKGLPKSLALSKTIDEYSR